MAKPVLTTLRVKRMASGRTIAQAARQVSINATDYGRAERLASKPSARVARELSQIHGASIETLLAIVKA